MEILYIPPRQEATMEEELLDFKIWTTMEPSNLGERCPHLCRRMVHLLIRCTISTMSAILEEWHAVSLKCSKDVHSLLCHSAKEDKQISSTNGTAA